MMGFLGLQKKGKKPQKRPSKPKPFFLREPKHLTVLPTFKSVSETDVKYPLLEPMVFARVRWHQAEKKLIYEVVEPQLDEKDKKLVKKLETDISEVIDVKLSSLQGPKASEYLEKKFRMVLDDNGIVLEGERYRKILYYILRDFVGLNEIEPLMHDPYIEDVGCSGMDTPIYVIHRKYGSLETNISFHDFDYLSNFVVKISERCGRYISYATPLLDGTLPDGSRVQASLAKDVTTKGPTFSIRKFRKNPFSPTDIINLNTADASIMAYLWLLIQYNASFLICGGVSTGKTTLLNALTMFIPPEDKIISIEDSVTGDSEILVKDNGIKKMSIKDYVDKNRKMPILTLDKDYKIRFAKPSKLIKHSTDKDIYEVVTSTGRRIKVTSDHSLFTWGNNGIEEVKPLDLKERGFIAVPRVLPIKGKRKDFINLLDFANVFNEDFLAGEPVKKILDRKSCQTLGVSRSKYRCYKKNNIVKISTLDENDFVFTESELKRLRIKSRNKTSLPVMFPLNKLFLNFVGLWLGDGSYDNYNSNRIIISNSDKECRETVNELARQLNLNVSYINDSVSMSINGTVFYKFMKHVLKLDGYSSTKRIPDIIFNLSNKQLRHVLRGYFSAKGTVKAHEVRCTSQSMKLLNDIQNIFLRLGIISRISDFNRKDKCISLSVSSYDNLRNFRNIGFLQEKKNATLRNICLKMHHTHSDIIPLTVEQLREVNKRHRILQGMQNMERDYLQKIAEKGTVFNDISHSDIFWDKVKTVKKLPRKKRMVYDISVPGTEKFICSNIILHNTREINLPHENWIPSVARVGFGVPEAGGKRYGEIDLFDLLKESFRQNPDYVIVGEVRGKEAYVMFQGIASGHASIGTVHAGSLEDMVKRLQTPPIELSPSLIESLDVVIVLTNFKEHGKSLRRVKEVVEVQSIDPHSGRAHTIKVFGWIPSDDQFKENLMGSEMLRKISFQEGLSYPKLMEEMDNRKRFLLWLQKNNIFQFDKVCKLVNLYYKDNDLVMKWVNKGMKPYASIEKKASKEWKKASGKRSKKQKKR